MLYFNLDRRRAGMRQRSLAMRLERSFSGWLQTAEFARRREINWFEGTSVLCDSSRFQGVSRGSVPTITEFRATRRLQ